MAAHRRVTVPQFLVAVSQIGLTLVVVALCAVETRWEVCAGGMWSWHEAEWWFRGYPIPWQEDSYSRICHFGQSVENGQDEHRGERPQPGRSNWGGEIEKETRVEGTNLLVPVALLVFALCAPPAAATALRKIRRWRSGIAHTPMTKRRRWVHVMLTASLFGLSEAQFEVLTDNPMIDSVPFAHLPGEWVTDQPQYRETVRWLQEWGRSIRPWKQDNSDACKRAMWKMRTRLTLAALTAGAICGCLIFRPWRRAPLS